MKNLCIILWVSAVSFSLYAQQDNLRIADIRAAGTGGNEVTQSVLFNPGVLPLYQHPSIHAGFFNLYGIGELSTFMGYALYPNTIFPVGFHVSSFGYEEYRENLFRLMVGKSLTEKWTAELSTQYKQLQSSFYDKSRGWLSADIGITFSPVEYILIGMLITDFPSVSIGNDATDSQDFKLYRIQMEFEWLFIDNLLVIGTLENNTYSKLTGSGGLEYHISDFWLRAGIKASPLSPSAGMGYRYKQFTIDLAANYHNILGFSSGAGLTYTFK